MQTEPICIYCGRYRVDVLVSLTSFQMLMFCLISICDFLLIYNVVCLLAFGQKGDMVEV